MNLAKKKNLAMRTFGVGKARITFVKERVEEIKEALTKQDIRELRRDGAIIVNPMSGTRKVVKSKSRSPGNIRKKVNVRKKTYVIHTRKLRSYLTEMKKQGKISAEDFTDMRKKIKNRHFKSKANLKEYIGGLK